MNKKKQLTVWRCKNQQQAKAEEADLMEDEMGFRPIGSEW